jgi:hypothetical protein
MEALGEVLTIKLIEELREKAAFMELAHEGMTKVPNGMYNSELDSLGRKTLKNNCVSLKKNCKK